MEINGAEHLKTHFTKSAVGHRSVCCKHPGVCHTGTTDCSFSPSSPELTVCGFLHSLCDSLNEPKETAGELSLCTHSVHGQGVCGEAYRHRWRVCVGVFLVHWVSVVPGGSPLSSVQPLQHWRQFTCLWSFLHNKCKDENTQAGCLRLLWCVRALRVK